MRLLAVLLASSWSLAAAQELTLAEALRLARDNNPDLLAARHTFASMQAKKDEATSQYFPVLTGSFTYQRQTGNFAAKPGAMPSGFKLSTTPSTDTFNYFNFALNLQQTIFDFGRTYYAVEAAKGQASAALKDIETVEQDVWYKVTTAYFQVLAAQEMVEVAQRNLQQARRNEEKAAAMVEAGTRPRLEAKRAKADRLGAESALIKAQDSLKVAKIALLQAIGLAERREDLVCVKETLGGEMSLDDAVQEAIKNRSDILAMRERLASTLATMRLYRSNFLPSLGFTASFSDAGPEIQNIVWNFSLGAVLNVPIFNGLLPLYQMREARAQAMAMEEKLRGLELEVRKGIEAAMSTYDDAKAALEPVLAQVEVAKEAMLLAQTRYDSGAGTYIELEDATAAYANAQANLVRAELDVSTAYAGLLRACGKGRLP